MCINVPAKVAPDPEKSSDASAEIDGRDKESDIEATKIREKISYGKTLAERLPKIANISKKLAKGAGLDQINKDFFIDIAEKFKLQDVGKIKETLSKETLTQDESQFLSEQFKSIIEQQLIFLEEYMDFVVMLYTDSSIYNSALNSPGDEDLRRWIKNAPEFLESLKRMEEILIQCKGNLGS